MKEFFPGIGPVKYEGGSSRNPYSFKYYNPDEIIHGKTMREQLRFSMAYWHTLTADGTDMFGVGTADKSFGGRSPMEVSENRVFAGFELMNKLGIDYFCFHDRDIAPEGKSLLEFRENIDYITDLIEEQMKLNNKKLLWGTANLFSNPRYVHGAATACNPDIFACAAAQIQKAIDITIRLGGAAYLFWGGREGYETLLNTDMARELDNLAYMLRLSVEYARSKGFKGCFYIEPKPKEPTKHQYDYDASSVVAFLRKYGLMDDFRLNIEANHATLAGHTFEHELRCASVNGVFGSVDANQGDMLLGWDTDQYPTNIYDTTLCMYEVLRAGGFTTGGLNFDAKLRRASMTAEDIFLGFIAGMDSYALGLRNAAKLIEDGRIEEFVANRYSGYNTGIGAKITARETSLSELADYACGLSDTNEHGSGRQEYLESVLNQIIFSK